MIRRPKDPLADRPTRASADASAPRGRSKGRLVGSLVASVVLAGFLLLGVFPTRTYLAQRSDTATASAELAELEAANAELEAQVERLGTPAEIERIAREEYGLVREGEEAYAILPPPPPAVQLPEVWPFVGVADELNR